MRLLNINENKIVVSPIKLFGESKRLNSDDIIPSEWIKI